MFQLVLGVLVFLVEGLAFVVGHAGPPAESLGVDDDALDAGRHFQAVVLDVLAGPAEDGVQQLFLGRQLALALGRNLADEDVARLHEGADADDAVVVEVGQGLGRDVRNVARELFLAQLRLADFDLEFLDVDRRVRILLDQLFADDDGILEVVAVPGHERDQDVAAQRQFARASWRRRRR